MMNGEKIEQAYQKAEGDDFEVYRMGLCYSSVCSSLGDEETVRRMQSLPAGTTHGYQLSKKENFTTGETNSYPCEQRPKTHKHYLFEV